jgi:hypothetical protein
MEFSRTDAAAAPVHEVLAALQRRTDADIA